MPRWFRLTARVLIILIVLTANSVECKENVHSRVTRLRSGDIELNPGPGPSTRQTILSTSGNINETNLKDVMTELRSMGRKMDEMKSGIKELKPTTDRVDKRCKDVEEEVTNLRKENRQLRNKLDNLDGQRSVITSSFKEYQNRKGRIRGQNVKRLLSIVYNRTWV